MLEMYVNSMKKQHKNISVDFVKEYIAKSLIFSYIDLYVAHDQFALDSTKMLSTFEDMAIFD